jgi:hypothetical protein
VKPLLVAAGLAFAGTTAAGIATHAPAFAQGYEDEGPAGEVDFETFYRELAPHGRWFEHRRYGTVWSPSVEEGWKPYSRGHWANTEEHGWYWVAEEEWGWAPFHYGRWAFDDDNGWFWVPGTTWGPAWVTWRGNDEHIGWAPLPPDADWEPDGTLRFHASSYDSPRWSFVWNFVEPRYMFEPGLHWHLLPRGRSVSIIRTTRPVHRYSLVHRRVYNHGFDVRRIESLSGRSVPSVRLRFSASARDDGWRHLRHRNEIPVYRPRIVSRIDTARPDIRPREGGFFGGRRWDWSRRGAQPESSAPPPSPREARPSPDWRDNRDGRGGGRWRDRDPDGRSRTGRFNSDNGLPQVSGTRSAPSESASPPPPNIGRSVAPPVTREPMPQPRVHVPAPQPQPQPQPAPQTTQPGGGRTGGEGRTATTPPVPRAPATPSAQPSGGSRPATTASVGDGRRGGGGGGGGGGRGERRRDGTADGQPRP